MKKILILLLTFTLSFTLSGCKRREFQSQEQYNPYGNPIQIWMSGNDEEKKFLDAMAREFSTQEGIQGLKFKVIKFSSQKSFTKI